MVDSDMVVYTSKKRFRMIKGFTLIDLMAVVVIIGVIAAVAIPRFVNLSDAAKVAALEGVAGSMKSAINLVKAKAIASGLVPVTANPGAGQTAYIVDFGGQTSEVDFRNLCPESIAELGDSLRMLDFLNLNTTAGMTSQVNNQYTLVGFDIPSFSVPTNQGCYVAYDSFGFPACTVTVVTADC